MSIGPWQIIVIVLLIVLLFGKGKISSFMADLGRGMKSFKEGLEEEKNKDSHKEKISEVTVKKIKPPAKKATLNKPIKKIEKKSTVAKKASPRSGGAPKKATDSKEPVKKGMKQTPDKKNSQKK